MVNPSAKDTSGSYGTSPKRTVSILNTVSCVFQEIIPYGAQILVALVVVIGMGYGFSVFDTLLNLIYLFVFLPCSIVFVAVVPDCRDACDRQ